MKGLGLPSFCKLGLYGAKPYTRRVLPLTKLDREWAVENRVAKGIFKWAVPRRVPLHKACVYIRLIGNLRHRPLTCNCGRRLCPSKSMAQVDLAGPASAQPRVRWHPRQARNCKELSQITHASEGGWLGFSRCPQPGVFQLLP